MAEKFHQVNPPPSLARSFSLLTEEKRSRNQAGNVGERYTVPCGRPMHSVSQQTYTHTHTHTPLCTYRHTHTHTHSLSVIALFQTHTHTHTHLCFFSIVCSAAEAGPERRIYMVSCTRERCKDQIRAEQSGAEQHSAALP